MALTARHRGNPLPVLTESPHVVITLFTDDPDLAAAADRAGIDRIGPDLEVLGKAERQRGLGYRLSRHRADRLRSLREAVRPGRLFARTDPVNARSGPDVESLLAAGVDVLMLPMFTSAEEVRRFCSLVGGRAKVVALLETSAAVRCLEEVLAVPGVDEVHIGLNDLALSLRVDNRFNLLAGPLLDDVSARVRDAGIPFGVGGIGRLDDAGLPVPPDLVYAALARLGATRTLLSRSFLDNGSDLGSEVAKARSRLASWWQTGHADRTAARDALERLTG